MSSRFDPYHRWLGIPPEKQPPNHYVLLAIEPFESHADVIETAADRQMAHLRNYQSGQHADLSQRLLNEVAAARVCLLNPQKKAAYDDWLRESLKAQQQGTTGPPAPPPAPPPAAPPPAAPPPAEAPPVAGSTPVVSVGAPQVDRFKKARSKHIRSKQARASSGEPVSTSKVWLIAGLLCVCLLLVVGVIIVALSGGNGDAPGETCLVFDWPLDQRKGATIHVGDKELAFPESGPLVYACKAGEHQVRVARLGFETHEETVKVTSGQRKQIAYPTWKRPRRGDLVLQWAPAERAAATLRIDSKTHDVASLPRGPSLDELVLTLEPGTHTVRIDRPGYRAFSKRVTVVAGQNRPIRVVLIRDDGTSVSVTPPPGAKLAVPSEAVQQGLREQIDEFFRVADAETAEQKLDIAKRMLAEGQSDIRPADQRYIRMVRAFELAAEADDAAVVRQVIESITATFQVDPPAIKRQAFEYFVRHRPTSAQLESLLDTDEDRVSLGDAYWDVAESQQGRAQEDLRLAAGGHYEQVLADAADDALKTRLAPRMEQIDQIKQARQQTVALAEAEQTYRDAAATAETKIAAWDFRTAAAELEKLNFPQEPFKTRVAGRRDEVRRLGELKARIIARINAANPPLQKQDLHLSGQGGQVQQSDEAGIKAVLRDGTTEVLPWGKLSQSADTRKNLLELVIDNNSADDCVAAALLALTSGDAPAAERYLETARSNGADVSAYLETLAAAAFARAQQTLTAGNFAEAETALTAITQKYAATSWHKANASVVQAALKDAEAGVYRAEAEQLYQQAKALLAKHEPFQLRPLVEKLKTDFPNSPAVTDTERTPSFAELEIAVAGLGKLITVSSKGTGDHKTIQAAIDAAEPKSLIEIADSATYNEKLDIPTEKEGLTIRGKQGCWPVVTSNGQRTNFAKLLLVNAPQVTLERLALAHTKPAGDGQRAVRSGGGLLRIRHCVLYCPSDCTLEIGGSLEMDHCVIAGTGRGPGPVSVSNTLWYGRPEFGNRDTKYQNVLVKGDLNVNAPCELRGCTIIGKVKLTGEPNVVVDCIMPSIEATKQDTKIDYCNVFGKEPTYIDNAKAGKGCLLMPPMFVNPGRLNFQLAAGSPCLKKASDGGAMGCRFRQEILNVVAVADGLLSRGLFLYEQPP